MSLDRLLFILPASLTLLAGCSLQPISRTDIEENIQNARPDGGPWKNWTELEPVLSCVGDRLREARIKPITVGYNVVDTTGKTGVNQGLVMQATLQKVAARGNGLSVTSWGPGPVASGSMQELSPQKRLQIHLPLLMSKEKVPDWIVEGGVTSVEPAFLTNQSRAGLSGRDLDLGYSATDMATVADLTYTLKDAKTGVSFPGATIDLRISYQAVSNSLEAGAFIAGRVDGRSIGTGLRLGRSRSLTQPSADMVRLGAETAVATLLAERFQIDLGGCVQEGAYKVAGAQVTRVQDLPKAFAAMSAESRVKWVQDKLNDLGYGAGVADGQMGPRSREALLRYQRDKSLTVDGQIGLTVLSQLAQDSRGPSPSLGGGSVKITLDRASSPQYPVGAPVRAQVSAPIAGAMLCYFESPRERLPLFPFRPGQPAQVSARTPIELTDDYDSGQSPGITVTEPGAHGLYCALTRTDLTKRLPVSLRAGGRTEGYQSLSEIAAQIKRIAGADWIGDGGVHFDGLPRSTTARR